MEVIWSYLESFCIIDMEDIFQMISAAGFWKIFFFFMQVHQTAAKIFGIGFSCPSDAHPW